MRQKQCLTDNQPKQYPACKGNHQEYGTHFRVQAPGLIALRKRHSEVTVLADLMTRTGLKQNFGTEVYPGTALISTASWLQANPASARGIAKAVTRSLRWCRDHTAHEIAERTPAAFRSEDRAGYEQSITHLVDVLSRDGIMPRKRAEAEKRMLSLRTRSAAFAQLDVSEPSQTNTSVKGKGEAHLRSRNEVFVCNCDD